MIQKFDVIIPLKSTNRLILDNIKKLSEFSAVSHIRIGNAGIQPILKNKICKIEKVIVYDQMTIVSQGSAIKHLIQNVETEYFAYIHGDVTLPEDWFKVMYSFMNKYDFAECARRYMHEYIYMDELSTPRNFGDRPLSGAQMGNTKKVLKNITVVEDDYLYRNEDIIFADLIKQNGGKYGLINDTFHWHQIGFSRQNENISSNEKITVTKSLSKMDIKVFQNQICGIVKYLKPTEKYHLWHFDYSISIIKYFQGDMSIVRQEIWKNKRWLPVYYTRFLRIFRIRFLKAMRVLITSERNLFD